MKNLLLLVASIFSFSFFLSCGEESFEPYDYSDSYKKLTLLPSEITMLYVDESTGDVFTYKTFFTYNSKNQLTSIDETSPVGFKKKYDIAYDIDTNNVTEVSENSANSSPVIYTYEYDLADESIILEHVSIGGVPTQTNTLTLNVNKLLLSKDDPNNGVTNYKYDFAGNLTLTGGNSYIYDNTKGWMSAVQTPHWLFNNFADKFPGAYNLVNNTTNMAGNIYQYVEFNPSKYPVKILNNNVELTIQYTSAKYISNR